MLASAFDFHAPSSLEEALARMQEAEGAKALSGGMSMVPSMNLGILRPESVVSLNHVAGLDHITEEQGRLRLGAMVRHQRVADDPVVRRCAPVLAEAARHIGDVQIRNRGTIGGSIAHADPAADYLPALIALDATMEVASVKGRNSIPARQFFHGPLQTALGPSELIVEIDVPILSAGTGAAYERFARLEGSFSIVNAAALADDSRVVVAIGAATSPPALVEVMVAGGAATDDAARRAGEAAFEACVDAFGDLNAGPEYRRALSRVFARRVAQRALEARLSNVGGEAS